MRVAHRVTKNKREAYRINALLLLGKGWTYVQVSDALLIDEETLRNYIKRYRTGGLKSLLSNNNLLNSKMFIYGHHFICNHCKKILNQYKIKFELIK